MKIALLRWIGAKAVSVHDFHADDLALMIEWIQRYSERREMDFADASLVWLADSTGCRRIMTTDIRDFTRCRLSGAKRTEII